MQIRCGSATRRSSRHRRIGSSSLRMECLSILLTSLDQFLEESFTRKADPVVVRANLAILTMPLSVDVDSNRQDRMFPARRQRLCFCGITCGRANSRSRRSLEIGDKRVMSSRTERAGSRDVSRLFLLFSYESLRQAEASCGCCLAASSWYQATVCSRPARKSSIGW